MSEHEPEAQEAITAWLVRLTLGGRGPERPELRPLMHTCHSDYYALLAGKRDGSCAGCVSLGTWPLAAVQHAESRVRGVGLEPTHDAGCKPTALPLS